jgi:hypothetical protein
MELYFADIEMLMSGWNTLYSYIFIDNRLPDRCIAATGVFIQQKPPQACQILSTSEFPTPLLPGQCYHRRTVPPNTASDIRIAKNHRELGSDCWDDEVVFRSSLGKMEKNSIGFLFWTTQLYRQ